MAYVCDYPENNTFLGGRHELRYEYQIGKGRGHPARGLVGPTVSN
jgi:hypothetical protein